MCACALVCALAQTSLTRPSPVGLVQSHNLTRPVCGLFVDEVLIHRVAGVSAGEFGAGERVTAIFEWFQDCLRDPAMTYELILPSRSPLDVAAGRVRDVGLLPAATLNFRPLVKPDPGLPTLKDPLMQAAREQS